MLSRFCPLNFRLDHTGDVYAVFYFRHVDLVVSILLLFIRAVAFDFKFSVIFYKKNKSFLFAIHLSLSPFPPAQVSYRYLQSSN